VRGEFPKCRQEIHLAQRAKTPKPEINDISNFKTLIVILLDKITKKPMPEIYQHLESNICGS
jgi:hypothetical protein